MSSFESCVLSYLLNSLWQIPLLFAAAWMLARLVRNASAVEHRVWVVALILQSILPACSLFSWSWASSLLHWNPPASPPDGRVTILVGAGTVAGAFHLPEYMALTLTVAYSALIACCLARFVWRCQRLRSLHSEAVLLELNPADTQFCSDCAKRFGIHDVTLASSTQIFGPVTLGIRRKLVLFPRSMAATLSASELHTVIAHEFAHISRHDFLKNLAYELLSLPVTFHPFLQCTRGRVMESREMVCDEMAAIILERKVYAKSLMNLAARLIEARSAAITNAIGIFDGDTLERRLMKLTQISNQIRGFRLAAAVALCAASGAVTCATALALATHVNAAVAYSAEGSSKSTEPRTVPASEMARYILSKVPPKYPADAKKAGIQGKVVLSATISKQGTVEHLTVLSGPGELQQSSLDAVRQWTYRPFLVNGQATPVKTTINIIYSLAK